MLIISASNICPRCEKLKEKIRKDVKMCNECYKEVEETMLNFIKNSDNEYGFEDSKLIKEKFKYF